MLSDEEKAKDILINFRKYNKYYKEEKALSITISFELKEALNEAIKVLLTVYEKQSKEIEELKEDRKKYAEEYIHNNPWLYKQLNENYILRVESEQKEKQAYIDGTNAAHELCNKKWKAKIKAKIEEYRRIDEEEFVKQGNFETEISVLQSLLEKE